MFQNWIVSLESRNVDSPSNSVFKAITCFERIYCHIENPDHVRLHLPFVNIPAIDNIFSDSTCVAGIMPISPNKTATFKLSF